MEENKVVETPAENQENTKLTYEQLVNVANQLVAENRELKKVINTFDGIGFAFKILEYDKHFSEEVVKKAVSVIESQIQMEDAGTEDK